LKQSYFEAEIVSIINTQREFFKKGETLSVKWRIDQLRRLKKAVIRREAQIEQALADDLGRSAVESYLCDIGPTITEINEMIAGLRRWSRPELHFSGLMCFPSIVTKVYKVPYGVTLIISPFNFPFLLTFGVLAASIAGGNTAVIKSSTKSPACTAVLDEIIAETFPPEYVTLLGGGHEVADMCLSQHFDKVFYTGSPKVAKHVLELSARNLTPVALELGGENGNWCIVRADADLPDAARKIAFFKACNAGQICINVNQVAVAAEVVEPFLAELKKAFEKQLGPQAQDNAEYSRLITAAAYSKCEALAQEYRDRIVYGGNGDPVSRRYSPTVIYPVSADEEIVRHELFNPLLPIVPFVDAEIDKLLEIISSREHPLAFYLFTKNLRWAEKTMRSQQFGGGCVNEVCVHLMVKGVPFCGTGHSGMGAYHGVWGFREFTHPQTVLYGSHRLNLSLREHPYSDHEKKKMRLLKLFER